MTNDDFLDLAERLRALGAVEVTAHGFSARFESAPPAEEEWTFSEEEEVEAEKLEQLARLRLEYGSSG